MDRLDDHVPPPAPVLAIACAGLLACAGDDGGGAGSDGTTAGDGGTPATMTAGATQPATTGPSTSSGMRPDTDTDTDTETDTDTTTGAATCERPDGPVDDCCCVDGELGQMSCSAPALCDGVWVECAGAIEDDCAAADLVFEPEDAAALQCILQALADGGSGSLGWRRTGERSPGQFRVATTLWLNGDGPVFVRVLGAQDITESVTISLGTLAPSFDPSACLALPTPQEQFGCLETDLALDPEEICLMNEWEAP